MKHAYSALLLAVTLLLMASACATPGRLPQPEAPLAGSVITDPRLTVVQTDLEGLPSDGAVDTEGGWYLLNFDGARSRMNHDGSNLQVDVLPGGSNTWSVQLLQAPVEVRQGVEYEVRFLAWADRGRSIEVKVGGSAGRAWAPYNPGEGGDTGGTMVDLTDTPERHSFTFVMTRETDESARFEFQLGKTPGTVYISDVALVPTGEREIALSDADIAAYVDAEWELSWAQEFDEPDIDRDLWLFETGNGHTRGIPGWGNAERQYYTNEEQNAFIRDGSLVIRAREEERTDQFGRYPYTSARMITEDTMEVQYGRIDVRAKMPIGQGIWPAVWMLGSNLSEVGWPESGEIDIMEYLGHEPYTVHGTVHGPGYSGSGGIGASTTLEDSLADDFHVYSIVWDEDVIIWLINDQVYHAVTAGQVENLYNARWVFNEPFYLLLNLAVGGYWPGYPDEFTEFPQEMVIDYIRIYERQ